MTHTHTYPHKASAFLLASFLFLAMVFAAVFAQGQTLSGRSVDTSAISGQQQSCQLPALKLQQRIILLRQGIQDILACNAQGGLYQGDGVCRLAVLPDHDFKDPAPNEPENRSGLSFRNIDGTFTTYGIIGGIDGRNVSCRRLPPDDCTPDEEERTLTCPDGTVIVIETRQFLCPEGIWTAWMPTGNTCDDPPPPPPPPPPPGGQCVYNGTTYEEGESFTLFAPGAECETCDQRTFTCTADGVISPNPANYPNYTFTSLQACLANNPCDGEPPVRQCVYNGVTYEDGEVFSLFSNQGLACDNCNGQSFRCDDGTIVPPVANYPSYTYTTQNACLAANACGSCNLPAAQGGVLGHGQSRQLYIPRLLGDCFGDCRPTVITCTDGVLSNNYSSNLTLTCAGISPQSEPFCYCRRGNDHWLVGSIRHFTGPGDGRYLKCCEGLPLNLFVDVSNDANSGGSPGIGGDTDEECQ